MNTYRALACIASIVTLLPLAGCAADDVEEDAPSAAEGEAFTTHNALHMSALQNNKLTRSGVVSVPLTASGLSRSNVKSALDTDASSREVLKFMVGCALPSGQRIDVKIGSQTTSFQGELGLARQWGGSSGSCDERCQQAVSACLLARVNHTGATVPISLRGAGLKASGVPGDPNGELDSFPFPEATYFGNVFGSSQKRYMCTPDEVHTARVCGTDNPSDAACGMSVLGACDECDDFNQISGYRVCRSGSKYFSAITVFKRQP